MTEKDGAVQSLQAFQSMHRFRLVLLAIFAALSSLLPSAIHAAPGELVSLPWNQWQFRPTDDAACAASASTCAWVARSSRVDFEHDTRTFYWARREIQIDPGLAGELNLALLIQEVQPVYEVYANGHLIGASGSFRTRNGPLYDRQIFLIPRNVYADGRLTLTIHVLNLHVVNRVGHMEPWIGAPAAIERQRDLDTYAYLRSQWQHYLSFLLVFFVSLFFLVLFLIDRAAREYLWFALLLMAIPGLRFFELGSVVDLGVPSLVALFGYASFNVLAGISFVEFPFAFLDRAVPWYFRVVQAGTMAISTKLLIPFLLPDAVIARIATLSEGILVNIQHYSLILAMMAWIAMLPKCFRSQLPEMRWIGGSMSFLAFEEANRHLTLANLPGIPQNVAIGTLDFDVRACAFLMFAVVMLVAMTFRFRRIQERNRKVEQELAAAAALQTLLLSSRSATVGSFSIESVYHPAGEVGGDFFHVASAGENGLVVVVGDVSGKGLKAAMTVASIIGALRDFGDPHPSAILAHLNRVLYGQVGGFVTCCVARLEPDGMLHLANAGHIPPYCNGRETACAPGLPLGILEQQEWAECEVCLEPDTRLIFVSDGVVEAAKSSGELFGFERTREISGRSAEAIASAAQAFTGGAAQNDDITVLGVQYQPSAVAADESSAACFSS